MGAPLIASLVGVLTPAWAHADRPRAGALHLVGEIHGAPFELDAPANWNGKLLVTASGYRDRADHRGETGDRTAHPSPSLEFGTALYRAGWALAGTSYRRNGHAVREALKDLPALARYFRHRVGKPRRTLLLGGSLGRSRPSSWPSATAARSTATSRPARWGRALRAWSTC